MKIYHNPRCSKSRKGLEYLKSKTQDIEIIEYLKTPFTEVSLKEVLKKLNKKPSEIVREHEDLFKEELKGKNFTDEEWIKILLENPKLIHRPIVEGKYKAVIGNPVEDIDVLL